MKVLNFGSLNIDYVYRVDHFVAKGETISSRGMNVFSGGKGLNQSVALGRANADVYHAGMVGEDGRFLLEMLEKAGVHTELVKVDPSVPTGNAIIQNDSEGDNCIILFGGANQCITKEYVDTVLSQFEKGDYLILQNEINELEYIVRKANEIGMFIVLNPSPMNEKILTLPLKLIDCFILNEVEASQILGQKETDADTLIRGLRERFPESKIVLTLGEKGSVYADGELFYEQPAKRVQAVDTTAAGDTYTGYFVSCVISGDSIPEAMKKASTASAIAVTRPGAAPSIPAYSEVMEVL